jgi:hypothetical protein
MRHRAGKPYMDAAITPVAPNTGAVDALVRETATRSTPVARKRQERRLAQQAQSDTVPLS